MNNLQQYNYFLSRLWNVTSIYFTNWTLFLQALYYFGVLKRYQESILFITIFVSFMGLILAYVYPRRIVLKNIEIEVNGVDYQIIDLMCHQIPLLLLLLFYDPKIKPDNLIFGSSLILIYTLIFNPLKVYNFDKNLNRGKFNKYNDSVVNKFFFGDGRYYIATGMIFSFLIVLIFAVKYGAFK